MHHFNKSVFFLLLCLAQNLSAQKVGLVLSGGGAKGLAHIGVLKALEENNIPIDYIAGTSMGGLVGGFYAAGYSAKEIDSLARSSEFQDWVNGRFPEQFNTYFYQDAPTPKWFEITLGVDSTFDTKFKPQFANDVILNFALAENLAPPNQAANANFDSLFIPFKAVGAEIFTQRTIYMDSGNLGAALRATMSVPFVYRPIKINGQYMFDGGVYENFPAEMMRNVYQPDFIIGVNVSTRIYDEYPTDSDAKLVSSSLLFLMMDKSDPSKLGPSSQYIEPNLTNVSGFDFAKASAIIDSGYVAAMRMMPEILEKFDRRVSTEQLQLDRKEFRRKIKPYNFSTIELQNFRLSHKNYVKRIVNPVSKGEIGIDELKSNYLSLMADPYFANIYPRIDYQEDSEKYKLTLESDQEDRLRLQLGGNLATSGLSNLHIGAKFDHLNYLLFKHQAYLGIGEFYKNFEYSTKLQFPIPFQLYAQPFFRYNGWDYLNTGNFLSNRSPIPVSQFDRNYGVKLVTSVWEQIKLQLTSSVLRKLNQYGNNPNYFSSDTLDRNRFYGFHHGLKIYRSDLNNRVFPSKGTSFEMNLTHNYGNVNYIPGSTSNLETSNRDYQWIQFSGFIEKYFPLKHGNFGFNITGKASSVQAFNNLTGTLLNSPAYIPTFESSGLYLQNFRAPIFLAGGIKYQYEILKNLYVRTEAHVFKPLVVWQENENQIRRSNLVPDYYLSAMGSIFYKTPIGPISISAHHYDDNTPFLLLFNIGFMMFNDKPFE